LGIDVFLVNPQKYKLKEKIEGEEMEEKTNSLV